MSIKPRLRRTVGTALLALYGIGNIVGAGVYVLVGKVAEPAGYLTVLAFLIASLVAFCAALSYAELAARFPVSAGISVYLHEAFKKVRFPTLMGILIVISGAISTATLLKGFGGYFTEIFPIINPMFVIVGVSAALLAVMLRGIKESVGVAAFMTIVEVGGLFFLIGSVMIARSDTIPNYAEHFSLSLSSINVAVVSGVLTSALLAFYAFIGFEDMVNIAEEVKKPQVAYPRAILVTMIVVTVLYVAVITVALGVLTPRELGSSGAPLATVYASATGQSAMIITAISLVAILNGIIVNIVMGSRFLYGLASRGWVTPWFSKVSRRHVPARGLIVVTVVAFMCALAFPIEKLAGATSLILLLVFFGVNVSLIVIRRRDVSDNGSSRISPIFTPWIGAFASGLLLVAQAAVYLGVL